MLRSSHSRRSVLLNHKAHYDAYLFGGVVILMMRAWAVWERTRLIAALLIILFLVRITERASPKF